MAALRSALFALLFYPGTLVYVLSVFAVSPFGSGPVRAVVHGWSNYHHFLVRYVLGIRMVFEGVIPPGPYLIAMKHQAMVETIEALRLADTPVVVMKRELTVMPLFGWVTRRYGVMGVGREAAQGTSRNACAGRAGSRMGAGSNFPEGTRITVASGPLRPGSPPYRALGLPWFQLRSTAARSGHAASSSNPARSASRSAT